MLSLVSLLKEKSPVKYEKFLFLISQAKDILPKIRISFSEFNNHDVKHAETVVKLLDEIIPDEIKKDLNCEEIFCLLCAAWLHDIGMVPNKPEIQEFETTDDEEKRKELRKEIRDNHHIRSYNFIRDEDSFKLDLHEKNIIAYISRAHRQISIQEDLDKTYRISSSRGQVRLQFLGALLRIADECDITSKRVSKHYIEESRLDWAFPIHIKKHELIDDVYLDETGKKIMIRAVVKSQKDMDTINRSKKDIEEEINEVSDVLKENNVDIDSVGLILDENTWIEKKIVLNLSDCKKWTLSELYSEIDNNKKEIINTLENLEAKKIIKKIEAENEDDEDKYFLLEDTYTFIYILEMYYGDDKLKNFIDYPFSVRIIEKELLNHFQELYNFIINDPDEIKRRVELLKKSPTAIYLGLHGDKLFDSNLNISLIQGKHLFDLLILIGFYYDMYRYYQGIDNIDEFINKYFKPLCAEICNNAPNLIGLFIEAQENAKKAYSEKIVDQTSEDKKDKYKFQEGTKEDSDKPLNIKTDENEGQYKFSMTVTSKNGEPNFEDMIKASQKTGQPIDIIGDRLSKFKTNFDIENADKVSAIQIIPEKVPTILHYNLRVADSDIGFNDLKFSGIGKNDQKILSTENRDLPYQFEFIFQDQGIDISKHAISGDFNLKIIPEFANVDHLLKWEEFMRELDSRRAIELLNLNSGKIVARSEFSNEKINMGNENWYELLKKLSYIQKKTGTEIKIPEDYEITGKDDYDVNSAFELLKKGETNISVNDMSFSMKVLNIKEILNLNDKVGPFRITLPNYQIEIFKIPIKFGPVNAFAPSFEIMNIDDFENIQEMDDMDSLKLIIKPKDSILNIKKKLS